MATYTTIADSEVNPGAIVDSSLMYRMRDNPLAIQEGDASAPKIVSGAFADNSISGVKLASNTVPGDRLQNNTVDATKLADGTVSFSKLQLTTGDITGSLNAGVGVDINLPQGTLNWRLEGGNSIRIAGFVSGSGSATQPGFRLINTGGSPTNYAVRYQAFA